MSLMNILNSSIDFNHVLALIETDEFNTLQTEQPKLITFFQELATIQPETNKNRLKKLNMLENEHKLKNKLTLKAVLLKELKQDSLLKTARFYNRRFRKASALKVYYECYEYYMKLKIYRRANYVLYGISKIQIENKRLNEACSSQEQLLLNFLDHSEYLTIEWLFPLIRELKDKISPEIFKKIVIKLPDAQQNNEIKKLVNDLLHQFRPAENKSKMVSIEDYIIIAALYKIPPINLALKSISPKVYLDANINRLFNTTGETFNSIVDYLFEHIIIFVNQLEGNIDTLSYLWEMFVKRGIELKKILLQIRVPEIQPETILNFIKSYVENKEFISSCSNEIEKVLEEIEAKSHGLIDYWNLLVLKNEINQIKGISFNYIDKFYTYVTNEQFNQHSIVIWMQNLSISSYSKFKSNDDAWNWINEQINAFYKIKPKPKLIQRMKIASLTEFTREIEVSNIENEMMSLIKEEIPERIDFTTRSQTLTILNHILKDLRKLKEEHLIQIFSDVVDLLSNLLKAYKNTSYSMDDYFRLIGNLFREKRALQYIYPITNQGLEIIQKSQNSFSVDILVEYSKILNDLLMEESNLDSLIKNGIKQSIYEFSRSYEILYNEKIPDIISNHDFIGKTQNQNCFNLSLSLLSTIQHQFQALGFLKASRKVLSKSSNLPMMIDFKNNNFFPRIAWLATFDLILKYMETNFNLEEELLNEIILTKLSLIRASGYISGRSHNKAKKDALDLILKASDSYSLSEEVSLDLINSSPWKYLGLDESFKEKRIKKLSSPNPLEIEISKYFWTHKTLERLSSNLIQNEN
ncbi:MAG: hypothetical protein ACXAC7_06935 [Candidatus Hodarchaeales archaeon]